MHVPSHVGYLCSLPAAVQTPALAAWTHKICTAKELRCCECVANGTAVERSWLASHEAVWVCTKQGVWHAPDATAPAITPVVQVALPASPELHQHVVAQAPAAAPRHHRSLVGRLLRLARASPHCRRNCLGCQPHWCTSMRRDRTACNVLTHPFPESCLHFSSV